MDNVAGIRGALAEGQDVTGRSRNIVHVDLCGVPVPAIVPGSRSPVVRAGFQVLFLLCSDECAKAVCLASAIDDILADREPRMTVPNAVFGLRLTTRTAEVGPQFGKAMELLLPALTELAPRAAERFASALGSDLMNVAPGSSPLAMPETREQAQALMSTVCAWCLCAIPDDVPVTALYVTLQGEDRAAADEGGIVMIGVGSRRLPICIAEPDSVASATGDAAFRLCSAACVSALTAAIKEDQRLSVVH